MTYIRPLKRFGQNYLADPNIIRKIAEEINPAPGDNIIEIGPGRGALTGKLLEFVPVLTAIEIDNRVGELLLEKFPGLNLISGDFLKIDLNQFYTGGGKKLKIAGNIPYNLTSPILFRIIENHRIIQDAVLMTQLEVAQRITAKRGTKEYGILAVLLNFFCDIKFCFKVSPNVFEPKPKVWSAVLHLFPKEIEITDEGKKVFIQTVKAAFGNRRKTLKNSLSNSIFKEYNFEGSGIDLTLRAEQLEINDFLILSEYIRTLNQNRIQ